ncbi:hypothetical protein FPQ18DRAFT_378351 [Pyronema domesticum]|uniref:Similar to 3-oxoacyl-[acyl-carrier-protein] reductase 1 acc. no. P73574 n=1 Tax=Pyronema omphalodes (strain CBS 100304) TaxID=1076935 RepID=U4LNE9_PYROM|nr:hypothetical protein FPQ18DRAFT_378351 [Pyronema domesticum]CCX30845.1 Similar to 3-oxoacyl-[acyl-carrier-protein] reductase 1; acc. no. P73574 [Pyronema omphalodes CBS 100304]
MSATKPLAIIAGVGTGTGSSVAHRFAKSYTVALLARSQSTLDGVLGSIKAQGGEGIGISTNVTDPESIGNAFQKITQAYPSSSVAVAIFNVSGRTVKPFLQLSLEDWKSANDVTTGAYLFSHHSLPLLLKHAADEPSDYCPSLIFTGATASVKANANSAAFATPKWAARALSQSLAKEFAPQGVHVAHAIIDGPIDIPRSRDHPGLKNVPLEDRISPEAIADTYWWLHTQPKTCFTWEIDIRNAKEKW